MSLSASAFTSPSASILAPALASLSSPSQSCEITSERTVALEICKVFSGSEDRAKACVVCCRVVAKIYDPLYYKPDYCNSQLIYVVDKFYAREASSPTPRYYGSWTLEMAASHAGVPDVTSRTVRIILMEQVLGLSLEDVLLNVLEDKRFDAEREGYLADVWALLLDSHTRLAA